MLEKSLIESAENPQRRKPWTVLLSTLVHIVLVALLLLVPLTQPQVLPALSAAIGIPLPLVPAPKPEPAPTEISGVRAQTISEPGLTNPEKIPTKIAYVVDDPAETVTQVAGFHDTGVRDLVRAMVQPQPESTIPEPPPPPAAQPAPRGLTGPVRVSSMERANVLHQVAPVYPPLAKSARVQGVVILEATISRTGDIADLRVISGHPLLVQAAIDAVQQWKYKPTFLSGEPVDVVTTITVNFSLQ